MTPPVQAVIFDLDGTLVQTRQASWAIFSQVNERFGLGVDDPDRYFALFRGNIFESLRELCPDEATAQEATAVFLDLLRREYTPAMVPGMRDVVRRLAGDCTLAVMSSNAMTVLRRVLQDNDLALCFAHAFGGDVTPDKRAAIRALLADAGSGFGRRCAADYDEAAQPERLRAGSTVLVTDTAGDVRDALATGIRVVGVAWGMHSVQELLDAGAEFVALWPQEITAHLLGAAAATPAGGACAVPMSTDGSTCCAPTGTASRDSTAADCGCGCSPGQPARPAELETAAATRRARRRDAAGMLAGRSARSDLVAREVSPELLRAVRRVCLRD